MASTLVLFHKNQTFSVKSLVQDPLKIPWVTLLHFWMQRGQAFQGFPVSQAGLLDDFFRQIWGRWLAVPADRVQIVPHILFIKARLRSSRGIRIYGPESGGVRCQNFVNDHELTGFWIEAKLKLRVRNEDTLGLSPGRGPLIDPQAHRPYLLRQGLSNYLLHLVKRDVLVMAFYGLRRGGEDQ